MTDYTARITQRVQNDIDSANKEIAEFTKKLTAEPQYAMEWADSIFTAAAKHRVAKIFQGALADWTEHNPDKPFLAFLKMLHTSLMKDIVRGGMYPPHSTGMSHNMASLEKISALAHMCEKLEGWIANIEYDDFVNSTEPTCRITMQDGNSACIKLGNSEVYALRKSRGSKFFILKKQGEEIRGEEKDQDAAIARAKRVLVREAYDAAHGNS